MAKNREQKELKTIFVYVSNIVWQYPDDQLPHQDFVSVKQGFSQSDVASIIEGKHSINPISFSCRETTIQELQELELI